MKNNLLFDFIINKDSNTVLVKREFNTKLDAVWDAFTKPEILDLWWAPKPWVAQTKVMDFKEGGYWLYAMVSPQNEKHWARNDFHKIEIHKSYTAEDSFCDENGIINHDLPLTKWTNEFSENASVTTISITVKYDNAADLEKMIEMGFKEGFTMTLAALDELLKTIKNK